MDHRSMITLYTLTFYLLSFATDRFHWWIHIPVGIFVSDNVIDGYWILYTESVSTRSTTRPTSVWALPARRRRLPPPTKCAYGYTWVVDYVSLSTGRWSIVVNKGYNQCVEQTKWWVAQHLTVNFFWTLPVCLKTSSELGTSVKMCITARNDIYPKQLNMIGLSKQASECMRICWRDLVDATLSVVN